MVNFTVTNKLTGNKSTRQMSSIEDAREFARTMYGIIAIPRDTEVPSPRFKNLVVVVE